VFTAQIIALLLAIAKAVPPLADLCKTLIGTLKEWDQKRNEATALERKASKDDLVDQRIADAQRVHSSEAQQQRAAGESTGLPASGSGSSGVDKGSS
jgi:hypothetical protein